MFKKKSCRKCGEKISSKYEFCPYCGNLLNESFGKENWGMLGKNDFIDLPTEIKLPMGLNTIFNSLMKNFSKQFSELDKEIERGINQSHDKEKINAKFITPYKRGINISISTSGNKAPKIKIKSFGDNLKFDQKQEKKYVKELPNLSKESLKKISKLPKQTPSTNIRRLSDKVIYEINMPNVKSIGDISIIRLENSIEIKALAKNKAYSKLIPMNLPIINYEFSKGKLTLELSVKN